MFQTRTPYRINTEATKEIIIKYKRNDEEKEKPFDDLLNEITQGGFTLADVDHTFSYQLRINKGSDNYIILHQEPDGVGAAFIFVIKFIEKNKSIGYESCDWYYLYSYYILDDASCSYWKFFIALDDKIIEQEVTINEELVKEKEDILHKLFKVEDESFTSMDDQWQKVRIRRAHRNFYKNTEHGRALVEARRIESEEDFFGQEIEGYGEIISESQLVNALNLKKIGIYQRATVVVLGIIAILTLFNLFV